MFLHKQHIVTLYLHFTVPKEKNHIEKSAQAPHPHWEWLLQAQQHRQPSTAAGLQNTVRALPSDFKQWEPTHKSSITSLQVAQFQNSSGFSFIIIGQTYRKHSSGLASPIPSTPMLSSASLWVPSSHPLISAVQRRLWCRPRCRYQQWSRSLTTPEATPISEQPDLFGTTKSTPNPGVIKSTMLSTVALAISQASQKLPSLHSRCHQGLSNCWHVFILLAASLW